MRVNRTDFPTQCQFPFKWEGQTFEFCSHAETPASRQGTLCKLTEQSRDLQPDQRIKIYQIDGTHLIGSKIDMDQPDEICYSWKPGGHGWCLTDSTGEQFSTNKSSKGNYFSSTFTMH